MQSAANFYLIKDLSRLSGHSIHTLKFYLKLQLIKESGRSPETRFRYFDETTLTQLSKIRAWRKQRKSLAEIRSLLASSNSNGSGFEPAQAEGSRLKAEDENAGRSQPAFQSFTSRDRSSHEPPASSLEPPATVE